jgi:lysophospholipase L1-like esterase
MNWYGDCFYITGWNETNYNGFHNVTRIDDSHFKYLVLKGTTSPGTNRTGALPICNVHSGFKRNGCMHVVNARLGQPFRVLANLGAPSERASQVAADVNYLTFAHPTWVYCAFGVNDLFATSNIAQSATATQNLILRILGAGPKVIYQNLTPVTAAAVSYGGGALNKRICSFNQYMREWAQLQPNLVYFDAFSAVVNPTSLTAVPLANTMIADGIHYSIYGAQLMADALLPLVEPLVSPFYWAPTSICDAFVNNNVTKEYYPNPLFDTASGGALSGGGTSGTAAGSLTITSAGNGTAPTAVCSVVARTVLANGDTYGNNQQVVFTGGNGSRNEVYIDASIDVTNFTTNDYIYAACAADITGVTGAKIYTAALYLIITIAGVEQWVACMKAGHDWSFTFDPHTPIVGDIQEVWKTPVVHLTAQPDTMVMRMWVISDVSGTAYTLQIGRPAFWKETIAIADIGPVTPAAPP